MPRMGHTVPKVLRDFEDDLVKIEPSDVVGMKKVTSHMIRDTGLFNQIEFEDILEDYLACPLKYNLESNLKFKNPKNINKFIDSKLRIVVNRLHNDKFMTDWDREDIEHLVGEVIRSYSFASGERQLRELFNNFADYWKEYGRNFDVVKTAYPVSLEVSGFDVNGVIDLIVRDGDGVSLVHFVRTRDGIRNYHAFYMELLGYYALALREREDVNVENLMLYVLDEGKLYENEFKESEFVSEYIASAVKSISANEYPKFKVNCDSCEFSGLICQFEK
jgi:CRISPR/Cas system-associated exonuclease Cas4 (RecB family)